MKRLVLNIPDSEYRFFIKVIRNFPFVEVDEKKTTLLELEAKLNPENRKIWGSIKVYTSRHWRTNYFCHLLLSPPTF